MTLPGKRVETAKRQAVRQRNYRRARDRALSRLANAYPETYKELLEQEKISDEQLGKKWLDLDGNTGADMAVGSGSDTLGRQASSYDSQNQGNDGGEA
jgi:hypothetical protein